MSDEEHHVSPDVRHQRYNITYVISQLGLHNPDLIIKKYQANPTKRKKENFFKNVKCHKRPNKRLYIPD